MKNYELFEKFFIGIVKDAILGEKNTVMPENIDIDFLVNFIKMHKLSGLLYPYLKERGIESNELYKDFNFWLTVETHQAYYLEKIREKFEAAKIRFVCIKGAYLKTLYPEPYMRSAGDIDIFVDDENTDKAREIMEELGFTVERFNHRLQDDVYNIGSFVHIEIHRKLISSKCPWNEKCQEIIDRIVPKADGSYEYVMTAEDFYLHMIGHMAKHMKYSGCGIKMFLDIWVYTAKTPLDRKILDQKLKYCGLDIFEKETVKLIDYWFNGKDADGRTKFFGQYIFESGMFGTTKQYTETEMAENLGNAENVAAGVTKKLAKALFLPYSKMCVLYPTLEKCPALLPFYWVYRAFVVLILRRNKITEKMTSYDGIDIDEAKRTAEFKKSIGV